MIGKTNANGFTGSEEESVINYDKLPFSYIGNITNIVKKENVVIVVPSNTTVIFVSYDNGNTFEEVVFSEKIVDVIYSKTHGFYFALSASGYFYTSNDGKTFEKHPYVKPGVGNIDTYLSVLENGEYFIIAIKESSTLLGKRLKYSEGTFSYSDGSVVFSTGSSSDISANKVIKSKDVMMFRHLEGSSYDVYFVIDKNLNSYQFQYDIQGLPYFNGSNFIFEITSTVDSENYISYKQSIDAKTFLTVASFKESEHEKRKIFEHKGMFYGFGLNGIKIGKTVSKMFLSELEYDFPVFEMQYGAVFEDGTAFVAGSGSVYKMFFDQKYTIPTLNLTLEAAKECYKKTIEAKEEVDKSFEKIETVMESVEEIKEVADNINETKTQVQNAASSAKSSELNANTYKEQSEAYKDQSQEYANNASEYASDALTFEQNASASAQNASESASAAKTSEQNASASASVALTSAQNASASESAAIEAKIAAESAKDNAAESATSASNSAQIAAESAASVQGIESTVLGYKQAAEQAKTAAETAKDTAVSAAESVHNIVSDVWNVSKTYAVGEYCIYNNQLWKCKVQHTGQTPAEGTYWELVSVSTEIAALNSNLNYKLDVIYHNSQTSANDIYQTGIHICSNWTDYPTDAPDGQGILICYLYAGISNNGWYRQIFISAHDDITWVRQHTSTNFGSWKKLAFSDDSNVKDWTVILSEKDSNDYIVPNMSGYKEILITWGYVYCISKTMLIPYSVFKTLTGGVGATCFIDYPSTYVIYKGDTLIGLENNNSDNLIRVFAR